MEGEFARGFIAGANSLIATQWEINESSTAQILAQFYQGLSNKQPKLEALRQAKLQYLEITSSAAQQSPYFWAGLSFYGQDGALDLPAGFPLWGWGDPPFSPLLLGILLSPPVPKPPSSIFYRFLNFFQKEGVTFFLSPG
ncbi:MAG: CHAT domain-containing protein [Saprospirales bacterium]|nr:CHAT domain-containing protein [Saprospirales bacterium]